MKFYHVTLCSNLIKGFDKYKLEYDKSNIENLKYSQLFLLKKEDLTIGIEKYKKVLEKHGKQNDYLIILETDLNEEDVLLNNVTGTNVGYYKKESSNKIKISKIYDLDNNEQVIEELIADSYSMNYQSHEFVNYNVIKPRTISFLPIAIGCNAGCPFCFSKNSISLVAKQKLVPTSVLKPYYEKAKEFGVKRSVITGGGEPSLVKEEKLHEYIRFMKEYVEKVVMISNGQVYTKGTVEETIKKVKALEENGLDVLAISRHGYDNDLNTKLMYLDTNTEQLLKVQDKFEKLKVRLICVLQKLGVENEESLVKYLDFASENNVKEICFKELYVSTSKESMFYDRKGNEYCRENQVPLSMVIDYLEKNGAEKVGQLEWGAPIYKLVHNGKTIQIACYTEPSVFWEQTNKLARSWNVLSDGNCYGSLEVTDSLINLEKVGI